MTLTQGVESLDQDPGAEMQAEHVDVLIVGAGLSGIGAACHLQERCPGKTFAILEAREDMGGTWDLFRYPGIRSDSDMFTLGYCFRPWGGAKAIADGASILRYIHDTARDYGVEDRIHFGHKVLRAQWSSADARWTVQAERADTGETVTFTSNFLYGCTRSEEHTSELQSHVNLVCRLLLAKKKY